MTRTEDDLAPPPAQYIEAQRVLVTMGRAAVRRISHLSPVQVFVLAFMGGFFIGMGALVSILLAGGVGTPGTARLTCRSSGLSRMTASSGRPINWPVRG